MYILQVARSGWWLFALMAAALLTTCWAIAASSYMISNHRVISTAVALDVIVILPVLYWLAVVRRRLAPARTLLPITGLCLLAASAMIPSGGILWWARHLALPAEIGLLVYLAYKVRSVLGGRRSAGDSDPLAAVTTALEAALGSAFAARLMATEFVVLYYALTPWKRRARVPYGTIGFPVAQAGTWLAALVPVAVLETVVVHIAVANWSVIAAWVLSGLSAYTALWVLGDYRALALRPTLVTRDGIEVRIGLRCSLRAPFAQVERVDAGNWRDGAKSATDYLNAAGLDSPNVLITFREPIVAQRPFGIETRLRALGIRVQDPDTLIRIVRDNLSNVVVP